MIVFDVSRLITRAGQVTPTGIDRVELAYARQLIAGTAPVCFVRATRWGGLALLPQPVVERYVAALAALWRDGASVRRRGRVGWAALRLRLARLGRRAFGVPAGAAADKPVYLLVSHHHLEKRRLIARLKRRRGMSFVCLIHDLIPIEFPEYARPGQDARHRRRIDTAVVLADAVIVPSSSDRRRPPTLYRERRRPPAPADGAVRSRAAAARRDHAGLAGEAVFRLPRHDRGAQKSSVAAQFVARPRGTAGWRNAGAGADRPPRLGSREHGRPARPLPGPARHRVGAQRFIRQRNRSSGQKFAGLAAAVLCRGVRFPAGRSIGARRPGAGQRHPGVSRDRRRCAGIYRPARRRRLAPRRSSTMPRHPRRGARRSYSAWPTGGRRAGTNILRRSMA